jgi:hypothetical protein
MKAFVQENTVCEFIVQKVSNPPVENRGAFSLGLQAADWDVILRNEL